MGRVIGCMLVLACMGCASSYQPTPAADYRADVSRIAADGSVIAAPAMPLTAAESEIAATVATEEIGRRNLRGEGPMYVVHTEMLRDKSAPDSRRAIVQHYSYAGDRTITTIVDLGQRQAVAVRETANMPAPLAAEEFEIARAAALADPRVREIIARYRVGEVVIEPMTVRASSREDPFFGRRIVRLMFRVGRNYLRRGVFVDLSTRPPQVFDDGEWCSD